MAFETSERFIVRPESAMRAWCQRCAANVLMLSSVAAANTLGVTQRRIFRLIEADAVHYLETGEGRLLICMRSLADEELVI